jgi:hypothetical protein
MRRKNRRWGTVLQEVSRDQWPSNAPRGLLRVLRSRSYLVQVYAASEGSPDAMLRLSVCRTSVVAGRWADGISWDDLQRLKREAGYGDAQAIEIYPPDSDVIDDANMRHLWILTKPLAVALT